MMEDQSQKMIIFQGRTGFNPNTLNNFTFTHAFAQWWQEQNTQEKMKEVKKEIFTYDNWIKLILDIHNFNQDWKLFNGFNFKCFDDGSLYGDGIFMTQLRAIAIFNPNEDDQIQVLKEKERFLLTEKLGQNRCCLGDQDPDGQFYAKFFALSFIADEELMIRFEASSFKDMNLRTVNAQHSPWATSLSADSFLIGSTEPSMKCKIEQGGHIKNDHLRPLLEKNIFLRLNMSRYNASTMVGTLMGFVQGTQIKNNIPGFLGWRQINMAKMGDQIHIKKVISMLSFGFHIVGFKATKKGVLIDFANSITDANTPQLTPIYPEQTVFQLKRNGKVELRQEINLQKVVNNCSGMVFCPKATLADEIYDATLSFKFTKGEMKGKEFSFEGKEKRFCLKTNDILVKPQCYQEVPISQTMHQNFVDFKLFLTQFGKPINGEVQIQLNSFYAIPTDGIENYGKKTVEEMRNMINEKLSTSKNFREKYISLDNIQKNIFQGHLKSISKLAHEIGKTIEKNMWINQKTGKPFELRFIDKNRKRTPTKIVRFVDGQATVRLVLDEDLTSKNNPRTKFLKSLAISGKMVVKDKLQVVSNLLKFAVKFFENEEFTSKTDKVDWIHDVGPQLKRAALLFPQMQRILDLYNFQSLNLPAMRRSFDVQDENDRRYMPNTREMSKIIHRRIRRWLYHPLYNKDPVYIPQWKMSQKHKAMEHKEKLERNLPLQPYDFNRAKDNLIKHLKGIWHVEFFTIPLYLSAQFTSPNKATWDLIRGIVKDQMKHVFIVSNILNAIHDQKLYAGKKAVPFDDPQYIPNYPCHPGVVFRAKNQKLEEFLTFDIHPCTPEQMLKLVCVQLPTETKELHFQYLGHPQTGKMDGERAKRVMRLNKVLRDLSIERQSNPNFKTIGDYYSDLEDMFWDVHDMENYLNSKGQKVKLFSGDPQQQFTYFGLENMTAVYDIRTCMNQMHLVVEEGEGSNIMTLTGQVNKESHFLKFIQVYAMCSISARTRYEETKLTQVIFQLRDDNIPTASQELDKQWSAKKDKEVDKKIEKEFSIQREALLVENFEKEGSIPSYPAIIAKPGFTNAYKKIVEELDLLFNTTFEMYKKSRSKEKLTEKELWGEFQIFRRKKLEDSVSRMRQMTLQSTNIIRPEGVHEKEPKLSTRPNYNLDFSQKTTFPLFPKKEEKP